MTALTREVQDLRSPVARWLRYMFPNVQDIQAAYRTAAGRAQVLPPLTVAAGTQGAAIDWWLRMLIDPSVSIQLAAIGIRRLRGAPAALELLRDLGRSTPGAGCNPSSPPGSQTGPMSGG